jgi:hypothetical protein
MTTNPHQRYQHWNSDDFAPINLAEYRRDLAEVREIEPSFGHAPADLFPDYRLDADLDPYYPIRPVYNASKASQQPDPFYYQAQGEEPPQRGQESDLERLHASIRADGGGRWSFKTVVCCTLFWVAVGEIVLLIWGY